MPYMRVGKCVYKKKPDGTRGEKVGCSDTIDEAKAYFRKLLMEEHKALSQFSMAIVDASIPDKAEKTMRLKMVNSDTDEDVFEERMSVELFKDFVERIENNSPVPEPFDVICEDGWKSGLPYLSISHYKSGAGANIPGDVEKVYVDGKKLKSSAFLNDTPLGNAVWKAICQDIEERNKDLEERTHENPVRISIGFLDLEHKHEIDDEDFVFTRKSLKQSCEKCEEGIGGKVYLKGQLVHLAFTRIPANPRTSVEVMKMSDEIKTKRDDAAAIIGEELAEELVGKSLIEETDALVVKAEERDLEAYARSVRSAFYNKFEPPQPALWVRSVSDSKVVVSEENSLYVVSYTEKDGEFTFDKRSDWQKVQIGLVPVKSEADEEWKIEFKLKSESEVVEDVMENSIEEEVVVEEAAEDESVETVVDEELVDEEEKSAVDVAFENFKSALVSVKGEGISKDEAIKALQPLLNEFATTVEREIDPETTQEMSAATVRSMIREELDAFAPQLAATILKGLPQTQEKLEEIPQPRSLLLKSSLPHEQSAELTQIQKIAQKSIGVASQ